ncbi:hypothetical protein F1C58_16660 (plasmid) [Glaciihabitans sp. INWT7]|uniref:hypothetical protein n=1 Tax=Glaciihabitans sp. INWT7 TaxID=2596912 RepID=UPI0016291817|nr:hypothetical protein [Glaciihabitans sp. INWT7]QNE48689.1 hypothetical protein F1C58_16660 [Glaciihabitans sp. INWT7]
MGRTAREPPPPKPTYSEFSVALLYQSRRDILGMQLEQLHAQRLYADPNAARAYYEIWIPVRVTIRRRADNQRAEMRRMAGVFQALVAFLLLSFVSTVVISIAVLGIISESDKASVALARSVPADPFSHESPPGSPAGDPAAPVVSPPPPPTVQPGRVCQSLGQTELGDAGKTYVCGKNGPDAGGHYHWNV